MAAARDYAAREAAFQNTVEACAAQGVLFAPMVAESTGAWEFAADQALRRISRAVAAREGTDPASAWTVFQQRLCVLLRRVRARAEIRRQAAPTAVAAPAAVATHLLPAPMCCD